MCVVVNDNCVEIIVENFNFLIKVCKVMFEEKFLIKKVILCWGKVFDFFMKEKFFCILKLFVSKFVNSFRKSCCCFFVNLFDGLKICFFCNKFICLCFF